MAETINSKPSLQIRVLSNGNGIATDKSPSSSPALAPAQSSSPSPSPTAKLLISHGKPNFTIPRSPKVQDNGSSVSPQPSVNTNYNAFKSANSNAKSNGKNDIVIGTKFNGVFKPSNLGNWTSNGAGGEENEAAKVVLRRPKFSEPSTLAEGEDENVPEFIRRQRRIQERLAKENVLDFENRRSGYFTHVMISPDSPNRTSFVETMASPAIVPALELPAPLPAKIVEEEVVASESEREPTHNGQGLEFDASAEPISTSHADDVAPEDVAQAIEEVNKAVAGEEDDKGLDAEPELEAEEVQPVAVEVTSTHIKTEPASPTPAPIEAKVEVVTPVADSAATPPVDQVHEGSLNGHDDAITISHTNGHAEGPSIPTPDPSGTLGVNYEPKTVVSFSQELGGGENNYPDTVKVLKDATPTTPAEAELQEMSKLKFDIKSDEHNEVQVTPVLRAEP
ncbi:uncharacterized protein LOC115621616 [Scaptodrosophila lebanonensis]|uniref:Uncharacterized protein LOC115621616 n=1 Tax=Drosophila lebanonensis TaxID=7225 RepID=A0A6J2T574_DROLE|nr:uncharacterized protein LOC115621616 [Scaptodrosophila lebanonensis]XP_030371179.1 uncharacterized protein LOC115621616 [Scaptodrosophila lebanonensis]